MKSRQGRKSDLSKGKPVLEPETSRVTISQDVSSVGTLSIRKSCTSAENSVSLSPQRRRMQCKNWEPAGNVWRSMMVRIAVKLHSCAKKILSVRTREPQTTTTICVPTLKHSTAAQPRGGAKAAQWEVATKGITPRHGRKKQLSPELAQQCRDVFCNTAVSTSHVAKSPSSLLAESGKAEWPVIMMLLEVTANAGQKIGTLIDLASDTNYITHITHLKTKRYLLKIHINTPKGTLKSHQLVCYDLDSILDIHRHVSKKLGHQKTARVLPRHPTQQPGKAKRDPASCKSQGGSSCSTENLHSGGPRAAGRTNGKDSCWLPS